ncbi:hypothetical protein [uncultured Mobiluncus sp.]|uniref:hypothetical protein n=1 Tax=uncultured Mobiluncus sp. TaxID=293425 RepID=UPI0027D93835|nr:hypothetical protein [uncultured Mobiluncus sp.]
MKLSRIFSGLAAAGCAGVLALTMTACASGNQQTAPEPVKKTASAAPSEAPADVTFGKTDSQPLHAQFRNATGKVITSLKLSQNGVATSDELLISGDSNLGVDKVAEVCYAKPLSEGTASDGSGAQVALKPVYVLQVVFEGGSFGSVPEITDEVLAKSRELRLNWSDDAGGFVYLTGKDAKGQDFSLLDAAKAAKQAADAQAAAQAAAQSAVPQPAKPLAHVSQPARQAPQPAPAVPAPPAPPVPAAPAAPAAPAVPSAPAGGVGQSGDRCVDDVIFK